MPCPADVIYFDGESWEVVYEAPHNLNAIFGTSANDIIVSGSIGFSARFNGEKWTEIDSGPKQGTEFQRW